MIHPEAETRVALPGKLFGLLAAGLGTWLMIASGCQGAAPTAVVDGRAEALRAPSHDSATPYQAFQNHTEGAVGEDIHGCPLPDSSGILFASNRHSTRYQLYQRAHDGQTTRRITHGSGDDLYPAVAPDGRIAFASNRTGNWRLYVLDSLDAAEPRRIGSDDAEALHPSWSPDGRMLAYSRQSPVSGRWELWLLELETSTESYLTEGLFGVFHPNGERLAFQRPRRRDAGWYGIWTIEVDGTREREIVAGADWGAVNPSWSPSGDALAFNTVAKSPEARNHMDHGDDLYRINADGSSLTRLTFSDAPEWNPQWGLDGRIYFTALSDTRTNLWSLPSPE